MKRFKIMNWGRPPELPRGKNGKILNWFSNFEQSIIEIDGAHYPTIENYFQAMKSFDVGFRKRLQSVTPSKAKSLGRNVALRPDWEDVKVDVMWTALVAKWTIPSNAKLLVATGDTTIVEWNNWGDRVWGATLNGHGQNALGIMLMEIRDYLWTEQKIPERYEI